MVRQFTRVLPCDRVVKSNAEPSVTPHFIPFKFILNKLMDSIL